MPDTQITDEMCLASAKSDYIFDGRGDWDKASRIDRERYCERSRKGLQAALSGHVVVPREPTREMLNAAIDVDSFKLGDISPLGFRESPQKLFERCYRAMIQAAPPVPVERG